MPFEAAPFGTTGLETAFAALYSALVRSGELPLDVLVTRMSQAPALIAGLPAPTLAAGAQADLCLIDIDTPWLVEAACLHSKSTNSAWLGQTLQGRAVLTIAGGRLALDDRA